MQNMSIQAFTGEVEEKQEIPKKVLQFE